MRPLRLDLAGFGVFRDETTVDFTDTDFFALVGPTGSGKSTLLDAVCFALYGTVPRWRDPRSVSNALAPSAAEARVRLVFETAQRRYVVTRVVRRDSKGRVKTGAAGMQRMPDGFDIRRLDTGLSADDLGEVLAGTPSELDAAVREVVGLPYDQFVTCVVLPQGEFAEFLHAKPATRQQILVNLLGLSVYEQVRERAVARAGRAEAQVAAADQMLGELASADDEALATATARVNAAEQLCTQVATLKPRLADAEAARDRAEAALRERDDQVAELRAVQPPADAAALAGDAAAAREARQRAADAVTAAEEHEEKLRSTLASAGDPAALRGLREAHDRDAQVRSQRESLATELAEAERAYTAAEHDLAAARGEADRAATALEEARAAYTRAQATDQAVALRGHLVAGEPCPVCTQPVGTVPEVPADSAVARAEADGKAARAGLDAAKQRVSGAEQAHRAREQELTRLRTRAESLDAELATLAERLADAPGVAAVDQQLAEVADTESQLTEATAEVRRAREEWRRAEEAVAQADDRLRAAWRAFESRRDALAPHQPPPADRDDLAAAWRTLADWAGSRATELAAGRDEAARAVTQAQEEVGACHRALADAFAAAQLPDAPEPGDDPERTATVAAERARAEVAQLESVRAQAQRLRTQRADHERDAQVARSLAQHLRANNFEAWLLEEALDRLVAGASQILRDLSGGQYDLVHERREFAVVDHFDGGLQRPVRTLSGGETFQASLALALALSEQLAGMASSAASLESIVLDEGFGTLDATTLDAVAATLENLAARGDRMVGVVTHVPALAERIPVRFEIAKDARSAHVTRVDG